MPNVRTPIFMLFALALSGCPKPTPRPTEAEITQKKDEWDTLPRSPEWLHATAGFSGSHPAECEEVRKWVVGEASCKAAMCAHGRDLARDWLARCSKLTPDGYDAVKASSEKLEAAAGEASTACGKDLEAILSNGCGTDTTCAETAQGWATRCAKAEGTPLVLRMLERSVERKLTEPGDFSLDSRSCDELKAFMLEGMGCAQQFACQDMVKRVEMYRSRCERSERPTVGVAMAQLSIIAGAMQPAAPIPVQPTPAKVTSSELPLALADGTGAALMMCNERPADLVKYVAARRACEGGAITFAKAVIAGRELEVRMGAIEFPNDSVFMARFPSLLLAGERELRDKEDLAAIEAGLTKAVSLVQAGNTLEAAFELFKAATSHVPAIRRSAQIRAAFTSRDEALAPALREIGKAKSAVSSRGRMTTTEFLVFVNRATTRPFADMSQAFSVQPGMVTPAVTLDTMSFMPKSTEAYLTALRPVTQEASRKRMDAKLLNDTIVKGYDLAKACGAAQQTQRESEQGLIKCVFALDSCDSAKVEALTKASDAARAAAESAFMDLHLAMTGPAESARGEIEQAMLARECTAPPW